MIKIAAAQFGSTLDKAENIATAHRLATRAKDSGASIVCFPELCSTTYFCWESHPRNFDLAETIPGPTTEAVARIAKETEQTLLFSMYEKVSEREYYNSCFIVNSSEDIIGLYRKNSIPVSVSSNGIIAANEKMYFKPGNIGFPVFDTEYGIRIGIMICYDRHYPEAARILGLGGADVVFVPTATFREPMKEAWELELRAHAFANAYYVCGVNKVGREEEAPETYRFFGSSLVIDPRARVLVRASDTDDDVVVAEIDKELLIEHRKTWPVFRDRRPDAYAELVR